MSSRLGVVGTTVYPAVLDPTAGDARTWSALGAYFDEITVIARTAGLRPRLERIGNAKYILLPQLPRAVDLFAFPIEATLIAGFGYARGIRTWSFSDPLRTGLVCLAMRLLPHSHLVVHLQGQLLRMPSDRFGKATPIVGRLSRFVARRADVVRVVSAQIAGDAITVGVPPERIALVRSRCDTEFFDPERWHAAGRTWRASFPGEATSPVVGFLGSFNASKGLDVLIAACANLARRRSLRLVLAGDGPLLPTLERAASLGEPPTTLLGRISSSHVPSFLSAIDVLAAPSHDEGLPRAVLEAMAMQIPVVASSVGGIPEAVEDGISGLLIPPGDPPALAMAIKRILEDNTLASRLGEAGRRRVLDEFDARSGWRRLAAIHAPDARLRG
jgi:glycosyltransferase involved in cell wall biosynthesis